MPNSPPTTDVAAGDGTPPLFCNLRGREAAPTLLYHLNCSRISLCPLFLLPATSYYLLSRAPFPQPSVTPRSLSNSKQEDPTSPSSSTKTSASFTPTFPSRPACTGPLLMLHLLSLAPSTHGPSSTAPSHQEPSHHPLSNSLWPSPVSMVSEGLLTQNIPSLQKPPLTFTKPSKRLETKAISETPQGSQHPGHLPR